MHIRKKIDYIYIHTDISQLKKINIMWSSAKSFEDLLELSKNALLNNEPTPFSFMNDDTDNVLSLDSINSRSDFVKMHDHGFLTIDSQPGSIETGISNFTPQGGHKLDIFTDIPPNNQITFQRSYVSGLMKCDTAHKLVKNLSRYDNISIVINNYNNGKITLYNLPSFDATKACINLTKIHARYAIYNFTNQWIDEVDTGTLSNLATEISTTLYNRCDELVNISIINKEYGYYNLNKVIIDELCNIK